MKKVLNIIDKVVKVVLNVFLVSYKLLTSSVFVQLVVSYLFKTGDYEYLRYPDGTWQYPDVSLVSVCLFFYLIELLLSVSFLALNLNKKWVCILWGVFLLIEGIILFAFLSTTPAL